MENVTPAEAREIKKLSRPLPGYWFYAVTMILLIVFAIGGYFAYSLYTLEQGRKDVDLLAKAISEAEQQTEARRRADNIGGKTPQETLQMYITAVEKGDYELASKYFIIGGQSKWLKTLNSLSAQNKVDSLVNPLKKIDFNKGNFSEDRKSFSVSSPVFVGFIFYPSGVWKITEI